MNNQEINILQKVAHTVRAISADAIEKQKSGHPGLPLGAAELGTFLYTKVMKHNPKNPNWIGRDRFILSAGHGSMLQYSLLHLCGYDVSMNDIKDFRQLHSKTPGHPELGMTPGVEVTTGPLGQGVAAGTGMAIAQKLLAERFGKEIFNSKIYILAGDGCLMEGISNEAGSLAGTLGLDNLVIIYDSNDICLDGPTKECFDEDVAMRYKAYGFKVIEIDGYDFNEMEEAFNTAKNQNGKPTLIIVKTIIGKYSPTREGSNQSHGNFLGPEMEGFKKAIGWPKKPFYVPKDVYNYMETLLSKFQTYESGWNDIFEQKISKNSKKSNDWDIYLNKRVPSDFQEKIWNIDIKSDQPTRKYNEKLIAEVADQLPYIVSGSADVASVDFTWLPGNKGVHKDNWGHQQIKFGVREFGMAMMSVGMNLHGMIRPVVGTFLVFSDYMRNAIRMSAMMRQNIIYIFTHDSLLIGQDGPTHQPIENLMSLRLIPNLTVIRPGDENEAKAAWLSAINNEDGPVAICFSRQPVKSIAKDLTESNALEGVKKGIYLLYGKYYEEVDLEIYASGSEINTSYEAALKLQKDGFNIRLYSVPSWEYFEKQDEKYRMKILDSKAKLKVSVEAGVGLGWQKIVGRSGLIISQESFGESAPEKVMADHFGFTSDKIYNKIKNHYKQIL
jgi:transketolase